MIVTHSTFTVAEYCQQMQDRKIIVNRDYQRSNKVWPPAARSYLIDTILSGFPIPKFSLNQRTDLRSRTTIKEIVDGQQRSQAILAFYLDEFRLSGKGSYSGYRYSQLEEAQQSMFLDYALSIDLFVGATDDQIRQVFRRINSYTIPLNAQERRHSIFQGDFKWFIVSMSEKYSQLMKNMGVYSELQLTRMADTEMLTEIVMSMYDGISSASEKQISSFYEKHDKSFPDSQNIMQHIDSAFSWIIEWKDIHKTNLMKPYNFFSLMLAVLHKIKPLDSLEKLYATTSFEGFQNDVVLANLSLLSAVQDQPSDYPRFADFIQATSSGTNRLRQRETRFVYYCRALEAVLL